MDFETKLFVKANAAELLEEEFSKPSYKPKTIMLGGVTDIYQPIERGYGVTRALLEVMEKWRHPVALITKSQLVVRDIDILARLAERGLAKAAISVTTLERRIARVMEPRAAAPHRRVETIRMLAQAGIPTTVMVAPIVPAINDREIEAILEECAKAGATSAGYVVLTAAAGDQGSLSRMAEQAFPGSQDAGDDVVRADAQRVGLRSRWGKRQKGEGPYAQLIADRFAKASRRLGLDKPRLPLDHTQFRRPLETNGQQDLF